MSSITHLSAENRTGWPRDHPVVPLGGLIFLQLKLHQRRLGQHLTPDM